MTWGDLGTPGQVPPWQARRFRIFTGVFAIFNKALGWIDGYLGKH
jgi:hypothetical protein